VGVGLRRSTPEELKGYEQLDFKLHEPTTPRQPAGFFNLQRATPPRGAAAL
jgi:hypothetical protein